MGLFDFFKSKYKGPEIKDLVWIDKESKMKGCLEMIGQTPSIQLVAWSRHTKEAFQEFLSRESGREVRIEFACYLNPTTETLYFLEHHLIYSKEKALLEHIGPANAVFLNSLEDPLLQVFNGPGISNLMQQMGMEAGETIEHPLISKAIVNAQKKMDDPAEIASLSHEIREWLDSIKE